MTTQADPAAVDERAPNLAEYVHNRCAFCRAKFDGSKESFFYLGPTTPQHFFDWLVFLFNPHPRSRIACAPCYNKYLDDLLGAHVKKTEDVRK